MAYPANLAVTNWGSLQSGNTADIDTNFRNVVTALNGIGNGSSVLSTVAISVASVGQANIGGITANSATLLTPLAIGSGGTNISTFSNNAVVVITAGSMTGILPAANGTVLTSNGTAWGPASFASTGFPAASPISNSLIADVSLANTSNYFDGPSVAQGNVGVWYVSGTVTLTDSNGAATFFGLLWDGTTKIDSCSQISESAGHEVCMSLSGFLASPAGNLRISVRDSNSTGGAIRFNISGQPKDSTITAFRIG